MAERAERKEVAAGAGIRRVDIEAQATHAIRVGRGGRGHAPYRQRREHPHAVPLAAVQQHGAVNREVTSAAEYPGIAGDAVHAAGNAIGNAAGTGVGRRNARHQRRRRMESGVVHTQRLEQPGRHIVIETLAADPPDHLGQQQVVQVTVAEFLAGPRERLGPAGQSHAVFVTMDAMERGAVKAGAQSGIVLQQLPDGDVALVLSVAGGNEIAQVPIQPQPAVLHQLHD